MSLHRHRIEWFLLTGEETEKRMSLRPSFYHRNSPMEFYRQIENINSKTDKTFQLTLTELNSCLSIFFIADSLHLEINNNFLLLSLWYSLTYNSRSTTTCQHHRFILLPVTSIITPLLLLILLYSMTLNHFNNIVLIM